MAGRVSSNSAGAAGSLKEGAWVVCEQITVGLSGFVAKHVERRVDVSEYTVLG
jgi:hypothetical protein